MMFKEKSKSYPITKEQVWEAFKLVKSKGGSAGVDGITIKQIAKNPQKHLYPVWNRLASGSYFPPAVKRVEIAKSDGGVRKLGIPTVKDRVAQMIISKELEEIVEPVFSENSFGYRPNKNAHQAVEQARTNCWKFAWVIDMDIKGFFDNIDHGLMIRALRHYTDQPHIITYVKRWLKAPIQLKDGTLIQNKEKGTPQGGVISPLLANIFLHFVFDKWMENNFPACPFERYADDIIVHAQNETEAVKVLERIRNRMQQCKLELHPGKTRMVYCPSLKRRKRKQAEYQQFDFLGFNVRKFNGKLLIQPAKDSVIKFLTGIREVIKKNCTAKTENLIRVLNPKIRGWGNYFQHVCSKKTFNKVDHEIYKALWQWASRRHPNKGKKWIYEKYFIDPETWSGSLSTRSGPDQKLVEIMKMAKIPIARHVKIKGDANPYLPEFSDYFEKRAKKRRPFFIGLQPVF